MVFTPGGEICAMSMLMANMSCLALSSYFSTILPTKRNLLTRFNTVFVLAMTAWVNALVRMSSFLSIGPYILSLPHWPLHSLTLQLTILNSVRRHLDFCDLFTDLNNAGNHLPGVVILVNICISWPSLSKFGHIGEMFKSCISFQTFLLWLISFLQAVVIVLSITRIFLIIKVILIRSIKKTFIYMRLLSANRVQPAGPW